MTGNENEGDQEVIKRLCNKVGYGPNLFEALHKEFPGVGLEIDSELGHFVQDPSLGPFIYKVRIGGKLYSCTTIERLGVEVIYHTYWQYEFEG